MASNQDTKVLGLEETAKNVIVESLGKLADSFTSRFCCNGSLKMQEVRIHYRQNSSAINDEVEVSLSELVLPRADEKSLSQFLAASSVASFGKGTEEVIDPTYRDAFKFDPDTITTSFDLTSTSILSSIETVMIPNRRIRAELHKLNIYTGPNGHFKSHVDTPRSAEMFGSLVVCLPTKFSGGTLVTRHQGQEESFDWSSTTQEVINWAAFFSDVEHEILPVTSGCRITLTYNLFTINEIASESFSWTPFYQYFQETLESTYFMASGGCLGFDCRHAYVFNHLNNTELLPSVLKGADYMVFSVAKSLGLDVCIKPAVEEYDHWYLLPKFSKVFGKSHAPGYEPEDFHPAMKSMTESSFDKTCAIPVYSGVTWCRAMPSWEDVLKEIPDPIKTTANQLQQRDCYGNQLEPYKILQSRYDLDRSAELELECVPGICKEEIPLIVTALKKLQPKYKRIYHPVGAYTYMGNEPINDITVCYQSAVILVDIPSWQRRTASHMNYLIPALYHMNARQGNGQFTSTDKVLFWTK